MSDDQPGGEPENPLSALMVGAAMTHELFRTYVEAGFTEPQALYLVAQLLTASIHGQQP
jgi:hypothetical protein